MPPSLSLLVQRLVQPVAIRVILLRERLRTGVVFNPLDGAYHQDPTPAYALLRERDPVHRSDLIKGWVLSRYEDIDVILRDHRRFSNDARKASGNTMDAAVMQLQEPSMLFLDPPDHTRLRSLVARAFTRSAIEAWRGRVEATVDQLLDEIGDAREFDLMETFANRLPTLVIAEMLGVPAVDYAKFREWSDAVSRTLEPTITPKQLEEAIATEQELRRYFDGIVEDRRREPREDLVSVLVAAEEGGEKLTHDELLTMLILLLVAGNETTSNLIGNGALALLRHPDQLAWLRAHPDAIDASIEELLRYDGPVQTDGRTVLEDMEIGGKPVKAGEQVILLLGSANRDPRQYPDPDRLDLSRGDKSHLGFGRGIHSCVGAPLARLEAQVAFQRLFQRFPDMRLADAKPEFKDHIVLRGLRRLPVRV